jgi:germination protein M
MRKLICIVTVCFIIVAMFSGCAVLQKLGLQKNDSEELHPVSSIVMNEDEAKKLTDKVPVHLYFANEDNSKLKLEVRYISVTDAKKSVNTLASTIVKELIKGPSTDSGLKRTIPAEAQLKSPVAINAGVATVVFTKEFVDKHPGGKAAEQMTIYSIVNSLTELKEIQKVKFTINGKAQKEFKGNFQFDLPFPKSTSLISKEVIKPGAAQIDKTVDPKNPNPDSKKPAASTKEQDPKKDTAPKPSGDGNVKTDNSGAQSSNDTGEGDSEATYIDVLE